jgi:hypothetical protein
VSNGLCGHKQVRLNGRTITTTAQWEKTACHEFGHVGGMGHRSTDASCMRSGASPPIARTFADLTELRDVSDTVVFGRVAGTRFGAQLSEDPGADYTIYTLEVRETVAARGRPDAPPKGQRTTLVEVAVLTHLEGAPLWLEEHLTPQEGQTGIWFLRQIAPGSASTATC